MGCQKIRLLQILLRAGLGVLVCASAGALCGCGSNENPPLSRLDKKPAVSAKPQVKEILPEPRPGATLPLPSSLGRPDANVMEVIPPDRPGGRGMTAAEVKARTPVAKPLDAELIEVIPPAKPGGRGLTAGEVKARMPAAEPFNPEIVQVIPPAKPGGQGLTAAEFMAKAGPTSLVDPKFIPTVPPPLTGPPSARGGK